MKIYALDIANNGASDYRLQVDLDGQTYGLAFRWNERINAWFMEISDVNDTPLVSGVRVVVGFPLANRSTNPAMFPGMLTATDTAGGSADPGLADLGARVQLYYLAVGSDG